MPGQCAGHARVVPTPLDICLSTHKTNSHARRLRRQWQNRQARRRARLAAVHTVTAFVHSAGEPSKPGARVVTGDTNDLASVRAAITGRDAVINTIGRKTPYKDTELEQAAARNIANS